MEASRRTGRLSTWLLVVLAAARPSCAQVYQVVRTFNDDVGTPYGQLYQEPSGAIYGTTSAGGAPGLGSVYRLEPDGIGGFTFHEIHAFAGLDGQQAVSGLVSGADGFLYGSTTYGGISLYGTVFQIDPSGRVTTLHNFTPSDGSNSGSRLAVGPDGFYGTSGGGTDGLVYRVKKDGTFDVVHTFNGADGSQPYGGVILAKDGWFYGTTYSGPGGASTIYRVSAGGSFESLHTLTSDEGTGIQRGLTEARGHFYGVASGGGANGAGTAFRVDGTGSFTKIHDFGSGGDDGVDPGAPVFPASDGNIYGSTRSGGTGGFGTLFQIDAADMLTTVHSFTGLDGREPNSQLMEAQDGGLYGSTTYTTHYPGFIFGVIFRFQAPAGALDVVYSFPSPPAVHPVAGLVEAANGDFYGTATEGGTSGWGSVYRLSGNLDDESVFDVHDFTGDDGSLPQTPLTVGSDGSLYGVASNGAVGGTAYRIDPPATFTLLHSFTTPEGTQPNAPLLEASPGNFYGATDFGGANGHGTAFHMDASGTVTPFHDFQTSDGTLPRSMMKALDGNLYGTCLMDGLPSSGGSVFEIALPAQTLTPFRLFDSTEGNQPGGPLVQTADGTFYGTTSVGGGSFNGTVFSMDGTGAVTPLHSFNFSEGTGYTSGLLLAADGSFYGVRNGGSGGVLYQITTDGTFSVLHQFGVGVDGSSPVGNLIQASNGGIYGVTRDGGVGRAGVIFRLWPAPAGSVITFTDIGPGSGPAAGGTSVHFSGAGLDLGATVKVGGVDAPSLVLDSHTLVFVTPPLPPASLPEIVITNPAPDGSTLTLLLAWLADFLDVDSVNPYHEDIRTIFVAGITAGCGGGNFCPDDVVTRGQMAVFLLKAEHGGSYTPPPCTGVFSDVPCTPGVGFPDWIEQLYAEQITAGCLSNPLRYCPGNPVTRAQMAVFLLKTEHGVGYAPNPCTGVFADVPCTPGVGFPDWIEQLYAENITGGCGVAPLRYCPDNPNLRRQMAVFLTKTFLQ